MPRKNPIPKPPEWVDEENPDVVEPMLITTTITADEGPEPEEDDIRAIVPAEAIPPTHHLVVGMGTLAAMSDEEFQSKLDVMKRGQARFMQIVDNLLIEGVDYGKVQGIDRPFLHQPGAEKLANFYGLAVEQIADRIVGRKPVTKIGDVEQETGEWLSPPIAYHVRSLVHLGDFNGPVIAQGYGEASSWEEKHRYRWQSPECPECGHELVKRKSPPNLAGKWNCPNWGGKGGCNRIFEPNDERIKPAARIENPDPWSLAETLIQMAAKRSLVAAVRRATGTSGFFTQDEDSPAVRNQVGETDTENKPLVVEAATTEVKVGVGAKVEESTVVQHQELKRLVAAKGLNGAKIADLLSRLFGMEVAPTGKAATDAVKTLNGQQMGTLLHTIATGELPAAEEATPGWPPQNS